MPLILEKFVKMKAIIYRMLIWSSNKSVQLNMHLFITNFCKCIVLKLELSQLCSTEYDKSLFDSEET